MRACAFGLVLFLRLLLFIFIISPLICLIVIVFADSLVDAVGGEVDGGCYSFDGGRFVDCIRAIAGTSGSCIVLVAIIISSSEELFEIIECLFVFWFFPPFLTVFCE